MLCANAQKGYNGRFQKNESIAVIGQGAGGRWTLELSRVSMDGGTPRLHVGKWDASGKHMRSGGFLTEESAEKLYNALKQRYEPRCAAGKE